MALCIAKQGWMCCYCWLQGMLLEHQQEIVSVVRMCTDNSIVNEGKYVPETCAISHTQKCGRNADKMPALHAGGKESGSAINGRIQAGLGGTDKRWFSAKGTFWPWAKGQIQSHAVVLG